MRLWFQFVCAAFCVAALTVPAVRAQQTQDQSQAQGQTQAPAPEQPEAPIPAYRSPLASAADNDQTDMNAQPLAPDTTSLTGVQNFSLSAPVTRTYWQPNISIAGTADSNALETPQGNGWGGGASISGGADVHRTSGNSALILSYVGGGAFSNQSGVGNGIVQELNFTDKFSFHREALSFFDELSYLPEASFGYGGLGGGTIGGLPASGTGLGYGQTILTGQGQNLQNAFATELDVFLTGRSSLTFVGGYTVLHYFDSNLLDYGDTNARAGYNYQLTRKDTIAISYLFNDFQYSNFDQSFTTDTVQGSYGRRVTGRLAFQIAAGPQVAFSHIPISGNGGTSTETSATQIFWTLNTALTYQLERTLLGFSYSHDTSGGSGVLAGSIADVVAGSASRQISRTFSSSATGGYSRNQGTTVGAGTPPNQTYDYWFAGANLSHPLGRALAVTLSYQLQYQSSNSAFCIGPTCGTSLVRNLISLGVGWHGRPMLF